MGLVKVDNELYSSLFANFILFFLMNTCDLVKHFGAYLLAGSGQTMENDWLIIIIIFFGFVSLMLHKETWEYTTSFLP